VDFSEIDLGRFFKVREGEERKVFIFPFPTLPPCRFVLERKIHREGGWEKKGKSSTPPFPPSLPVDSCIGEKNPQGGRVGEGKESLPLCPLYSYGLMFRREESTGREGGR